MAVAAYVGQPPRLEVEGMPGEGMDEEARRALAWLEAAATLLGRKGVRVPDGPLVPQGERGTVWEG